MTKFVQRTTAAFAAVFIMTATFVPVITAPQASAASAISLPSVA